MKENTKEERQAYFFDNKALLALIIPLVIEQLLAVLVGMADSIMIASVGEAAVSGVSLVDQIMILLINAFAALATGGAVVAGQLLGQKRREEACKSATQMVWFITICAVVITIIVYLGKSFILHTVFGKIDQDVMHHADIYLLIVAVSIPFMALYNGGAAIFRTMGNSKVTMQISIIMNVINIGGNALLIYGFHRGTEGVAIPTLVSRMTAAIIVIVLLCDEKRTLHIKRTWRYRCVGAGDYKQAKYYNKKLMMITYVSMTAMVLFIFALLPLILKAYNLSDITAKTTTDIIHFHGISAIFIWPVAFALPATFRAAGDAKACMYISSISMWIFRIGFSYVLGKYMGLGVFGVWVAMVIDWVFRAICFVIRYFRGSWKKNAIV